MTLNLSVPRIETNLTPQITVIGVGGAGGNAVNNMIQTELSGVEFLVANTDAQAIGQSLCKRCIQLGRGITQGLGSGARPDVGRAAAEEALDEILSELEGANMVFITAGMGGGTGTGAAPVIARAAREAGILAVGVVTKPFHFEGVHRMRLAESGITELTQYVDTLIVIPNQNLFRVANEKTTFADAFKMADDVLNSGVRGVTDLMVLPGLINLDFADIRSVMTEMGKAMMGTGEAEGENRAVAAAEAAISNPLLDDVSMKGARGVLINITGASDMTLFEVDEAANRIRDEVDPEANIIFGSTSNQELEGRIRVSVVATGIDADAVAAPRPVALSLVASQAASAADHSAASLAPVAVVASAGAVVAPVEAQDQMSTQAIAREHEPAECRQAVAGAGAPSVSPSVVAAVSGARDRGGLFSYSKAVALAVGDDATGPEPAAELPTELPIQPVMASADGPIELPPVPEAPEIRAETGYTAPLAAQAAPPTAKPNGAGSGDPDPFAAPASTPAPTPTKDSVVPPISAPSAAGPSRKRPQSLFAKVTGGATRALQAAAQLSELQASDPVESDPARRTPQPSAGKEPSEPKAPPAPATKPTAEPRLAGLDSAERVGAANSEEDLLDIPAFLRRQAN